MITIVDPPSGWRYGFPAPLTNDYRGQLRLAGYPEKDIEFALAHSRYWGYEDDQGDEQSRPQGQTSST